MYKTSVRSYRFAYFLITVFLLIYGIILARDFLYPITFGGLLAYLLYPFANFLEKKGIPRIFAILICVIFSIAIFAGITVLIVRRVNVFADNLPELYEKANTNIKLLEETIKRSIGISHSATDSYINSRLLDIKPKSGELFSATTGTIFAIGMQPVYIFLFLYYRTKFAYFILKIAGRENRGTTVKVLKEISTVATRYMLGVTTVVILIAILNTLGYLSIGIEYPLLLGVVAACFSFIPYFGTLIGGSIAVLFTLLTQDSPVYAMRLAVFAFAIHFIENNILSPNIVGSNIRINPFFIIVGLIFGAMVWGVPGMLVTIPFLAMFKIVIKNVPGLQAYSFLLGTRGTRRHALTVENIKNYWKSRRRKK
ncbi:MAG: AI-2E family transporter [Bacteroidales bacterium]|nr:AI-2E family transporter [Bacteroidales bacterium]